MDQALEWGRIALDGWLRMGATALAAAGALWIAGRLGPRRRVALRAVAALLVLHLLLLGNPLAWSLYAWKLGPADVGWRQYSVIRKQRDAFLGGGEGPTYLAVGSSQTSALFATYALSHAELGVFEMAAMVPLDFVMYREQILRSRPRVVLLYLSDFDVARAPIPEAISMAPRQGLGLIPLWSEIGALSETGEYDRVRIELLVGEAFPGFKYGFVLRGIVDKAMRRTADRLGTDDAAPPERTPRDERIRLLRESISERYLRPNLVFLEQFVDFAAARGVDVVIVEGQYHPDVSDERTVAVAGRVREALARLAEGRPRLRFLPRSEIGDFSGEEYTDLSHVRVEVGRDFAARLIERLER